MTVLPGSETPSTRQGSALLGILGAYLGGTAGAAFCFFLMWVIPNSWKRFAFLCTLFMGAVPCLGYCLFRGLRSIRFAWNTVRVCAFFSVLPGLLCARVLAALLFGQPVDGHSLQATLEYFADPIGILFLAGVSLFSLLGTRFGFNFLLRYADPAWYKDPRRLARVGGGGAAFNMLPCWPLPPAACVPESFTVDKKLTVEGDTITVNERHKASRSFSVEDVAGVVLGVPTGYNILYDKNNAMLAKFAWSRENALLLGQYLLQRGISFVDINGEPVPTSVEERTVPSRFTIREGKLCLVLGWVCVVFFGFLSVGGVFLRVSAEISLFLLAAVLLLSLLFCLGGVWSLLCYRNRRLEVDGEQLTYTAAFGRTTRFRLDDVADIAWNLDGCKVRSRDGKVLARFESNMENSDLFTVYFDRHIRQGSKERNGLH